MSSSFCHPAHSAFNTPVNLAQEAFSLDYFFSRFPGLGWLRRNTPSESPNLTSMVCSYHPWSQSLIIPDNPIGRSRNLILTSSCSPNATSQRTVMAPSKLARKSRYRTVSSPKECLPRCVSATRHARRRPSRIPRTTYILQSAKFTCAGTRKIKDYLIPKHSSSSIGRIAWSSSEQLHS